jgi:hypothetical protein
LGGELFYFPYDGNAIGNFQGDRIRNFSGTFGGSKYYQDNSIPTGPFQLAGRNAITLGGGDNGMPVYNFNPSLVVPTGIDNAPASISTLVCISY